MCPVTALRPSVTLNPELTTMTIASNPRKVRTPESDVVPDFTMLVRGDLSECLPPRQTMKRR
jgi:hypothetical protein